MKMFLAILFFCIAFTTTCTDVDDTIALAIRRNTDLVKINTNSPTKTKDRSIVSTMTSTAAAAAVPTAEKQRITVWCRLFKIGCPPKEENDRNGCCILTTKNKNRLIDSAGNRYGKLEGLLIEQINRTTKSIPYKAITYYKQSGITSSYPEALCGNTVPVQPTAVAKGLLKWNESIDYGACDPANVTLTQSSNRTAATWVNTYEFFPKIYPYGTGSMKWSCLSCDMLK